MQQVGFIGPSYTLRTVNVDAQRCVGWYPEINELGTGKNHEIASLQQVPGLKFVDNGVFIPGILPQSANRGMYLSSTGRIFAVVADALHELSNDANVAPIGAYAATYTLALDTSSGPVFMSDNGHQLIVVDGSKGYIVDMDASPTVTAHGSANRIDPNLVAITADGFPNGATTVAFLKQYFLVNRPGSRQFFFSALNDGTSWDGLDFSSKESHPDNLLAVNVQNGLLRLLGEQSSEVWYNSGDATNPFQIIEGATSAHGIAAIDSLQNLDGAELWVSADRDGNSIILMAQGYIPQRISTFAIENALKGYGDISGATSWTYQSGGHNFYALNFPTAKTTWVYDKSIGLWHERQSFKFGHPDRFRAEYHVFVQGKHLVGDYQSPNIYELSEDEFTDNGDPLLRLRSAPHISAAGKLLFFNGFQVDLESGVGATSGQGSVPKLMFDYSNDGAHTWSKEKLMNIGRKGQYKKRAFVSRLGRAYDRVNRVKVTDPVRVTLLSAFNDIEVAS